MGIKKVTDMNSSELQVFKVLKDKILKDNPILLDNTGDMREIINVTFEQEKAKLDSFQKQIDIFKQMLRQIEDNFYRDKGGK